MGKSTMKRLENHFDISSVHEIRRNCQCGYAMDDKLALVQELMALLSNMEERERTCYLKILIKNREVGVLNMCGRFTF